MADGNYEVGRAFITIVPTMQGSQTQIAKDLGAELEPASESVGESSGKKFGEALAKGLKTTSAVIVGAMATVTGAAIATGKAFVDSAKDVASFGDSIQKNAQKMGNMSYTAYQEWDFILQHCGSSIEGLKTSMLKLTKASEEGNEAFEKLGISQEDLANMSQEEIFNATITALQGVSDEAERTVLANELLGKSAAVELAPLLNMTADETEGLRNQVHELGGVMSDEAVEASATFQDEMLNMETSLDGLKKNMISQFLPSMSKTMKGLSKLFSGDKSGIGEIQEGLEELVSNLVALAPEFFSIAETLIMSLISGFGPQLPNLVSSVFGILIQAITTVTSMIPQMMPQIITGIQGIISATFQALPLIVNGLFTLVSALLTWLTSDDNITNFVNAIVQLAIDIVGQFSEILPVLLPAIVMIISEVCLALTSPENVESLVASVIQVAVAIFEALVNCVPVLIDFIVGLFDNLGGMFAKFLEIIVPIFTNWAVNGFNKVKEFGNNIKNFFSNTWNNIKNGVTSFFSAVGNFFTNGFTNIKNKVTSALEGVKNKFTSIFDGLKNIVKTAIDKIRSFFDFSWELPHLDMPHFSISGSFSLDPPSVPRLSVSWYAKAMNEPYILDDATIFGSMNGKLLGGGESGSEIVVGTDKLMSMIRQATGGQPITINVYGAEGQSVDALAEKISYKLEELTKRRGAVYG